MAAPFQSDVKVSLPDEVRNRSTIQLSANGDIQLVTGQDKLVQQMTRTLVNQNTFPGGSILNARLKDREYRTLVNSIFRTFRNTQVNYVNANDPDLTGYSIWRKAAGENEEYVKISDEIIQYSYIDTSNLYNHTEYSYGISRVYRNIYESKYVDLLNVIPTSFSKEQSTIIGNYVVAIPGNKQVTIYVDFNKSFKKSELLEEIVKIDTYQDDVDPRKLYVGVTVKTLLGGNLSAGTFFKVPLG